MTKNAPEPNETTRPTDPDVEPTEPDTPPIYRDPAEAPEPTQPPEHLEPEDDDA